MLHNLFTTFPISSPSFIDETTPSNNCFAFSFLLLKHHCQQPFIIFPDAETPLFNTFWLFLLQKHYNPPFPHSLHRRNNTVQQLFHLLLKHHCQQFFIIFPDAETPLFSTFYFPKTLQSAISSLFIDETTPSSNCFAFSFSLLKHHYQQLSSILFPDAETSLFNTV
jgi:hypothetical protein